VRAYFAVHTFIQQRRIYYSQQFLTIHHLASDLCFGVVFFRTMPKIRYDREMNHAENDVKFDYLEAEQQRLLGCVQIIRASGTVAPAYCWLSESSETKGSKTYTYVKLITEKPEKKLTSKSLGRPGSDRHREWRTAIERREAIAELEQQLKMVDALIERQSQALHLTAFLASL
jgi:hypothetical protein